MFTGLINIAIQVVPLGKWTAGTALGKRTADMS